jgi:hypothetical protein
VWANFIWVFYITLAWSLTVMMMKT